MTTQVDAVLIKLNATTDQLRREMDRAGSSVRKNINTMRRELSSMERQFRRVNAVSRDFARGFVGISIGAGVALGVKEIASQSSKLSETLSGVQAVTQATTEEMENMAKAARALGATTAFNAEEAAKGMEFLGMAGFETEQIISALPGVLNLAAAGSLDLGEAADIASNALSGMGLAAEESNRVADVLAQAAASSNTNVTQLGEALSYVGPVAAALNRSLEETTAALGTLSNAGIQASSAGTGLRGILSRLANPAGDAKDAIEGLGLTLDRVNPQTKSIAGIIDEFADAGINAAEAMRIFGDRAGPAFLALVSQRRELKELTDNLSDAAGAAQRMADVRLDNLAGDATKFGSAVSELSLKIGTDSGLTGALRAAVQELTAFVGQLNALVEGPSLAELQSRLDLLDSGPVGGRSGRSNRIFRKRSLREQINEQLSELGGAEGIRNQLQTAEDEIRSTRDRIIDLRDQIDAIPEDERHQTLGRGRSKRRTLFARLNDEINESNKELLSLTDTRRKLFDKLAAIELAFEEIPEGNTTPTNDDRAGLRGGRSTTASNEAEKFIDSLERLQDKLDPVSAKTRDYQESVAILDRAWSEGLISGERYDELMAKLATDTDAVAEAERQLAADREKAVQLIKDLDPGSSIRDQIIEVQRLRDEFPELSDALAEVELDLNDKWDKIGQGAEDAADQAESAWQGFGDIASSAFEDAVLAGKSLSDTVNALADDIQRLLFRNLVTNPLSGFLESAISGSGGFLGSIFGGARAAGGPVSAGRAYLVGERGPELFMPSGSGNIATAGKTSAAIGSTYNFSFVLPSDSVDFRRAGEQVARHAARSMRLAELSV